VLADLDGPGALVDRSLGLSVGEVADILINDYGVYNALNLDGGGSTTLAMEHPITHARSIVNVSSDNPNGRAVASSLAVFAPADTIAPATVADVTPAPPASHWNNSTVTLILTATDNAGGAVRELHFAFTGAHFGTGRRHQRRRADRIDCGRGIDNGDLLRD
jgi:Phosphodiester glycosidase